MPEFFCSPIILQLLWLGEDPSRDDKILSDEEVATLLRDEVLIKEKRGGANLGSLWMSRVDCVHRIAANTYPNLFPDSSLARIAGLTSMERISDKHWHCN